MIRVYLVRHAETDTCRECRYQQQNDKLSSQGECQAKTLSSGIRSLIYDRKVEIISANTERARQTAAALSSNLGLTFEITDLLNEITRPSVLHGRKISDPAAIAVKKELRAHASSPNYRYSDEETFAEIRKRVNNIFDTYLSTNKNKNYIFITHTVLMKSIIARVLFGASYTPTQFYTIYDGFAANDHAAISQIAFDGEKWKLMYWNNFSHLIAKG